MSKKGQKGEKKRKVKESLKEIAGGKARTKEVREKIAKSKKWENSAKDGMNHFDHCSNFYWQFFNNFFIKTWLN